MPASNAKTATQTASIVKGLRKLLLAIEGVVESDGVFGPGRAYWVSGTQVAHFDGDDLIEIRLTRGAYSEHRAAMKADPRVRRRSPSSDWIDVTFRSEADAAFVVELATLAARAHAPKAGEPMKPPLTGADLERRRRFH
jgi:hypothetical protein